MRGWFWAFLGLMLLLAACSTEKFEAPDIKEDFCGIHINYQYCKCAFHNDYCDSIEMDKKEANAYVQSEYNKWTAEQLEIWLDACEAHGGIAGRDDCTYCDEGFAAENGRCVPVEEAEDDSVREKSEFIPDGPLYKDCTIKEAEFNREWKKYSDIDEVIPFNERSYEAKQTVTAYDEMIEKMVEAFALERDVEVEEQMQTELEEYRNALVNNIQANLLKAFWRLSWVTYSTAKSGASLGTSYSQVLTSGASVETIGAGLKVVQGTIPKDSQLSIDTSTTGGKASSVGASTALEAIDSLGDPAKIATELFKSASNAALPSADITEEEINILRQQHLAQGVVDKALQESREANEQRRAKLAILEKEISDLQSEIKRWEEEEKERVKNSLETSCQKLKEQYETD